MEPKPAPRFRFDLADMFALTTAMAVATGLVRVLPMLIRDNSAPPVQIHLVFLITTMALGAAIGALFKRKRRFALCAGAAYFFVIVAFAFMSERYALVWVVLAVIGIVLAVQAALIKAFRPE